MLENLLLVLLGVVVGWLVPQPPLVAVLKNKVLSLFKK